MRRSLACVVAVAAVSSGVLAPAAAFADSRIVTVVDPTTDCAYSVYGPTVVIRPLPNDPGVQPSGGVGESVQCPLS